MYGKTAIPAGRYRVTITWSPKFKKELPLINNVPGYEGVRIHVGNDADDTDGCVLPGTVVVSTGVANSTRAFETLFSLIQAALQEGELWIDVRNPIPAPEVTS